MEDHGVKSAVLEAIEEKRDRDETAHEFADGHSIVIYSGHALKFLQSLSMPELADAQDEVDDCGMGSAQIFELASRIAYFALRRQFVDTWDKIEAERAKRGPAQFCAHCGEYWPCSNRSRRDISGIERAKHHVAR